MSFCRWTFLVVCGTEAEIVSRTWSLALRMSLSRPNVNWHVMPSCVPALQSGLMPTWADSAFDQEYCAGAWIAWYRAYATSSSLLGGHVCTTTAFLSLYWLKIMRVNMAALPHYISSVGFYPVRPKGCLRMLRNILNCNPQLCKLHLCQVFSCYSYLMQHNEHDIVRCGAELDRQGTPQHNVDNTDRNLENPS